MVAAASTAEVTNSTRPIASAPVLDVERGRQQRGGVEASSSSETSSTATMAMPEIGLADEPTMPAM